MSHTPTRSSLADILARAARAEDDGARLQAELRSLGGAWADVSVSVADDEVVVRSPSGEARLFRMKVTGWLLARGTFSPERAAERIAAALAPEIPAIAL